jgi:hypothetical protein
VYLRDNGRQVLTDFGIALTVDDGPTVSSGEPIGSPAHISPKRLLRGESAGVRPGALRQRRPFGTLTAVVVMRPARSDTPGRCAPSSKGLLAKEPERRLSADRARAALQDGQCDRRCSLEPIAHPRWTPAA